jgi:hypothetical protein
MTASRLSLAASRVIAECLLVIKLPMVSIYGISLHWLDLKYRYFFKEKWGVKGRVSIQVLIVLSSIFKLLLSIVTFSVCM